MNHLSNIATILVLIPAFFVARSLWRTGHPSAYGLAAIAVFFGAAMVFDILAGEPWWYMALHALLASFFAGQGAKEFRRRRKALLGRDNHEVIP